MPRADSTHDPIRERVRAEHPCDNPEVLAVPVAEAAQTCAARLPEPVALGEA